MAPRSRSALRAGLFGLAALVGLPLSLSAGLWAVALLRGRVPARELSLAPATSLLVLARDGSLLRELAARDGEGHAAPAHLAELPPYVWQAFVATEDARFFRHLGLDPLALGRAIWVDLRRQRFAQGGSTLTMQLARLLSPRPRTLGGKLGEAVLALRLHRTLTKQEELEQYLTRVPLGNGVRGVEAAARLYFGVPARALTLRQAALLAALPKAPQALDPLRRPERGLSGSSRVLQQMAQRGMIDPRELAQALDAPLGIAQSRFARAFEAPHFVEAVAAREAPLGAVRVETTLDLRLQRRLEAAARDELSRLSDRRVGSAAVMVIDNANGEVLAYLGSPDWFNEAQGGRIDGVRTLRQPGSALKPFAYGAALERRLVTAASVLSDVESSFATESGAYMPKNYDRRAHGPVRARVALASSYNVPAVELAGRLGPQVLLDVLHAAGFASLTRGADHYGLGLVLGDGEVTLFELARAYQGLSRGGAALPLKFVRKAVGADGRELADEAPRERRFLGPQASALIADILADPGARAPSFGLDNALRFPFPVAAKTGTSRAFTDNWVAGFTRERTVAVWVGNMSGETMRGVSGITGAGPLFHRAMMLAMEGVEAPQPLLSAEGLDRARICPLSGQRAGPHCSGSVDELFLPGTAPRQQCAMHGPGGVDLGPRYYDWAARQGIATAHQGRFGAGARGELVFPQEGDEFVRPPDLPQEAQTLPVRALAPRGGGDLELSLDGGPRIPLPPPYSGRVPARPGSHRLSLYRAGQAAADASASYVVR